MTSSPIDRAPLPSSPLASSPDPAAAEESPELRWLRTVYRKGERQLTVRAALAGIVIGAIMCLSNLYVVLKTGWSLGVTVTASILAFALFRSLRSIGLSRAPLSILENSAAGSVASGAGFMTGGGNMAAMPALLVLTGARPDPFWMIAWLAVIAAMGAFIAIPIKRQLVNAEALPFPTGMAAAETISSMHAVGQGADKARLLTGAGVIGAIIGFLRDAKVAWLPFNLPKSLPFPFRYAGHTAAEWTISLDGSLILAGAGALMGFRTGWSLLLGAIVTYGILAPAMVASGAITVVSYKGIVQWTLWPGAAVLLSSGLLSFALQWRSVVRSFSGLFAMFRAKLPRRVAPLESGPRLAAEGDGGEDADPVAKVECPITWFPIALCVLGPIVVFLMVHLFGIPWWAALVALPLSVIMGIVAARVTGETDVTPTKALGPVTQLVYGALVPGNLPANIMGANVTGGAGLHAADLLTDLKCGYLLGANPRQQLFAQLLGVVVGAAAVVPAFNLLVPEASIIGSAEFPAPAVQVWAGVSKALTGGLSGLPTSAKIATLVGLGVGAALVLLEKLAPKRVKPFVPSASGVGIAMVIPGYNAIAMFVGALVAEGVRRRNPALGERTLVPIASGFIAGESLMGILVAVLVAFGVFSK